ncbi:MAG: MFS transporter [Gemmataceae bacterium]|nr:MFS transporter [Gemmataceae bacterium]
MADVLTPEQVAARLDRLPVTRFHRRFIGRIALGGWFDMYDNFIAGTLAVALIASGVLPEPQPGELSMLGLFMASLALGMFLGSAFLGMASDYLGRRFAFIFLLLLYSLGSLVGGTGFYPMTAIAGASAGIALLLVTRVIAGAGIGAENVVMDVYVSEMVPQQVRGRAVAFTQAIIFTAVPVAALASRYIAPKERPHHWWLLLVLGSLGALFTWYFRRNLPESPRWSARVGRHEEAAQTLAMIEKEVEQETGQPLPPPRETTAATARRRASFAEIWSPRYRGRTLMLTGFHLLQTISYYGFMHWVPKFLVAKGFDYNTTLNIQLGAFFLAPLGPLLGMWSCERFQRKWLIVGLGLTLATTQMAFCLATDAILLTALGALIVICLNWFSSVFHAYQAELFPTSARATGVGFSYAWSRASIVATNLIMPGLIAGGLLLPFGIMAGAMVGVSLIVGAFGPLTNARSLEELSPSDHEAA